MGQDLQVSTDWEASQSLGGVVTAPTVIHIRERRGANPVCGLGLVSITKLPPWALRSVYSGDAVVLDRAFRAASLLSREPRATVVRAFGPDEPMVCVYLTARKLVRSLGFGSADCAGLVAYGFTL